MPPPGDAEFVAIWEALCDSRLPPPLDVAVAEGGAPAGGLSPLAAAARYEKYVKGKLSVAADHFNRDYKKGFQYLQVGARPAALRPSRGWPLGEAFRVLGSMDLEFSPIALNPEACLNLASTSPRLFQALSSP